MSKRNNTQTIIALCIMILATIIRIILKEGSPWRVFIIGAGADDWYQAEATLSILSGKWLGEYSWITLSKGVSFPLFLATIKKLGLSYGIGIGVFLSVTSCVATASLFPILDGVWTKLIAYIGILYCPIFFAPSSLQIYRNAIIPIATLGVASCAVGAFLRNENINKVFLWTVMEAIYFAFFWYLREDSLWIIPFCVTASIITGVKCLIGHVNLRSVVTIIIVLLLPYLLCAAYKNEIESINYKYYGISTTNDRSKTACADVMKLLYKIDDMENTNPDVWLSKKALKMAIDSSPTLSRVGDDLLRTRDNWAGDSSAEIEGDINEWVLRIALDNLGYYSSGISANSFYEQIALELEEAFEKGLLKKKKGIYLSSQTGAFHGEDFIETFDISLQSFFGVLKYNRCDIPEYIFNFDIIGENYQIMQAEYLLGRNVNRTEEQLNSIPDPEGKLHSLNEVIKKQRSRNAIISNRIIRIFRWGSIVLFVSFIVSLVLLICNKDKALYGFMKNDCIWAFGIVLSAFVNLYVVYLFSRWITRDPMGDVAEYYAPSAYIFVEFIKVGIMIPVIHYAVLRLQKFTKKN